MAEEIAKYEVEKTSEKECKWELVTMWKCPYCQSTFYNMSRYCPDCGEMLWEREE